MADGRLRPHLRRRPTCPASISILPDIAFVEKIAKDLVGIVITHAHEDHIGALADAVAAARRAGLCDALRRRAARGAPPAEPGAPKIPINVVAPAARSTLGPFDVEYVAVAHSIPGSLRAGDPHAGRHRRAYRRLEDRPDAGRRRATDEARLRALGDEGVLALICDSTNILREGDSPSEARRRATLAELIARGARAAWWSRPSPPTSRACAPSPKPRCAAGRAGRRAGRAMERVVAGGARMRLSRRPAGVPRRRSASTACRATRCWRSRTGSQGEPRAAMARIAEGEHPDVKLARRRPRDLLLAHHSRQREGGRTRSSTACDLGVEVITDRTHLVHCSGHPRRGEVARCTTGCGRRSPCRRMARRSISPSTPPSRAAQGVEHVVRRATATWCGSRRAQRASSIRSPHGRLLKDGDDPAAAERRLRRRARASSPSPASCPSRSR